jgi:nucleoside-diphosphate-sugar epimerase
LRLTSVFGPGQLLPEGATGAIAAFAWRALAGDPIVILGDPMRTRDFMYVDDFTTGVQRVLDDERWDETLTVASGQATPLLEAAELVKEVAGSSSPIETRGGELPAGENESYASGSELALTSRPLPESVELYVDWLRRHTPAQSRG